MSSVLLVIEEPEFAARVTHLLEAEGLSVVVMSNGRDGLVELQAGEVGFVLMTSTLSDLDSLEMCKQMRRVGDTAVIVLCDGGEQSVIACLEAGADDCVPLSISGRELRARMDAISRRGSRSRRQGPLPTIEGYEIDRRSRIVTSSEGERVDLTNLEFDLLVLFATNTGAALEREMIFNRVWGQAGLGSSRTIDTHVVTLRNKMPELKVVSVHGVGYRLETAPLAA